MRTSASQFELIVEFMEKHGDLNKPHDGPQGRVTVSQLWRELVTSLNMDFTGDTKTLEKWKKVWSDLKNNTKKKAAKINKMANQTGGGPACRLKLSDLELRVLNLMGTQAATGLIEIGEVGCERLIAAATNPTAHAGPPVVQEVVFAADSTPAPVPIPITLPITVHIEQDLEESTAARPSTSADVGTAPSDGEANTTTPRASPSLPVIGSRRRSTPQRRGARRTAPRPQADASRYFSESDERWRTLIRNIATEHARLREAELQQQAQWQTLFERFLISYENKNN